MYKKYDSILPQKVLAPRLLTPMLTNLQVAFFKSVFKLFMSRKRDFATGCVQFLPNLLLEFVFTALVLEFDFTENVLEILRSKMQKKSYYYFLHYIDSGHANIKKI